MNETNAQVFRKGMKDAIPIGLGYLAVAFSLGIAARNAGMNAFQGFLMSMLNNASAGEYAGITVIAANSPYVEMAIVTLITNARYLLMSFSHQDFPSDIVCSWDLTLQMSSLASPSQGLDIFIHGIPMVP